MHYEGTIEVPASPEKVYAFLVDPRQIITVIPDVQSYEVSDENAFSVKAKVGLSFIRGIFSLKFSFMEKKPQSYAKLTARGSGAGSSMDVQMSFGVEGAEGGGSRISWTTDARLGGLLVGVSSRLIDSASQKYIAQIVGSPKQKLSA